MPGLSSSVQHADEPRWQAAGTAGRPLEVDPHVGHCSGPAQRHPAPAGSSQTMDQADKGTASCSTCKVQETAVCILVPQTATQLSARKGVFKLTELVPVAAITSMVSLPHEGLVIP